MKLSLGWIFDHLQEPLDTTIIPELIKQLSVKVAEIDEVHSSTPTIDLLHLVQVLERTANGIIAKDLENGRNYSLPLRNDAQENTYFLIVLQDAQPRWACLSDVGGTKDTFFPSLTAPAEWRHALNQATKTTLLTISNTAITHRPDLWSHRGWAREIAALLGFSLKPLTTLTAPITTEQYKEHAPLSNATSYEIRIENPALCSTFAPYISPPFRTERVI